MAYISGITIPNTSGYRLTDRFKNESYCRRWRTKGMGSVDRQGRYHRPTPLGGPTHGMLWYELESRGPGSEQLVIDHKKGRDYVIFPKKYSYERPIHGNLVGRTSTKRLRRAEFLSIKDILIRAAKKGKLDEMADSLLADFPIFKEIIEKLSNKPALLKLNRNSAAKTAGKKGILSMLAALIR